MRRIWTNGRPGLEQALFAHQHVLASDINARNIDEIFLHGCRIEADETLNLKSGLVEYCAIGPPGHEIPVPDCGCD